MKIRSLKTLSIWIVLAAMTSSSALIAKPCHFRPQKPHQYKCHHHKHRSSHHHCNLPFPNILEAFDSLEFNTILGNLNDIFIAQSFAANPLPLPGSDIARLISAATGSGPGGAERAISRIRTNLLRLEASEELVESISNQLEELIEEAIDYSTAVANEEPPATQLQAAFSWHQTGGALADLILQLSPNFNSNEIRNLIESLINHQQQAILGYNGLLEVPFEFQYSQAVAEDQAAHADAIALSRTIYTQLAADANQAACPTRS